MLFAVSYTARDSTEEKEKRSLNLFTNWKPPAGYEFKAHYSLADGSGGLAIVEASSPAALLEAHAPWGRSSSLGRFPSLKSTRPSRFFNA